MAGAVGEPKGFDAEKTKQPAKTEAEPGLTVSNDHGELGKKRPVSVLSGGGTILESHERIASFINSAEVSHGPMQRGGEAFAPGGKSYIDQLSEKVLVQHNKKLGTYEKLSTQELLAVARAKLKGFENISYQESLENIPLNSSFKMYTINKSEL
ncbi:MAG: hypothetical protein JSR46_06075, partial [Verrucomicrobia bacterium]|nr:hypothetical protein [Verrucomicrobiota bacterium]